MEDARPATGPRDDASDRADHGTEAGASEQDQKTLRKEHPSGWLVLTRNESVPFIVDALLDHPPYREFTQTELADAAGVSRQSVARHLDLLLTAGVVVPIEGTTPQRYRFDADAPVSEALVRLDGAMNAAGPAVETETG
jgi:DNA-binding transcriptional ArsR family regulator